jgi:hypothetical protein
MMQSLEEFRSIWTVKQRDGQFVSGESVTRFFMAAFARQGK